MGTVGSNRKNFEDAIQMAPSLNLETFNKAIFEFEQWESAWDSHRSKNDLKVNKGSSTFLKKWGFTPAFFVKHFLRGGKFSKNKIISFKYDGPLNEPAKNFTYFVDLFISKIKFLKLILFKS